MKLHLSEILEKRNMSVNQLHKYTGISRTTLDPLAKSDEVPEKTRFETLNRICEKLDIPLKDLISFEEDALDDLNLDEFKIEDLSIESESFCKIKLKARSSIFMFAELQTFYDKYDSMEKPRLGLIASISNFDGINDSQIFRIFSTSSYNEISIFLESLFNSFQWSLNKGLIFLEFSISLDSGYILFTSKSALYNTDTKKIQFSRMDDNGSLYNSLI